MSSTKDWAQLVCTTDVNVPVILISADKFSIGRAKGCDLSLSNNKLVSGQHCILLRKPDGTVLLQDTSTNGTLVKSASQMIKKKMCPIQHGDEIFLVFKKNTPSQNVAYMFQDLSQLLEETQVNDDLMSEDELSENTQDYSVKTVLSSAVSESVKRPITEDQDSTKLEVKRPKRSRWDSSSDQDGERNSSRSTDEKITPSTTAVGSSGVVEVKATMTSAGAGGAAGTAGTAAADAADAVDAAKASTSNIPVAVAAEKSNSESGIAENLICPICQDIFHDCVSVVPCLHVFCAACYSSWMKLSLFCPTCRKTATSVSRNFIINNLVDAFVAEHPDKKRSDKEKAEMDKDNQIKGNNMMVSIVPVQSDNEEDSEFSPSDSDDDDFPLIMCNQCPYPGLQVGGDLYQGIIDSHTNMPVTSKTHLFTGELIPMPVPPVYVCPVGGAHVMCECCLRHIPDRRPDKAVYPDEIPSVQCILCRSFYCHEYWGCTTNCYGCLNKFKDLFFGQKSLDDCILNNKYESEILKNYLQSKNLTWKDLLTTCVAKLESGDYTYPEVTMLTPKMSVCYRCGLKVFHSFAYQYRCAIPNDELPAEVQARQNCHWGKNCTTQNKPDKTHHARNFNHVCEQTKFSTVSS